MDTGGPGPCTEYHCPDAKEHLDLRRVREECSRLWEALSVMEERYQSAFEVSQALMQEIRELEDKLRRRRGL